MWIYFDNNQIDYFKIFRSDGTNEVFASEIGIFRKLSKGDLKKMYEIACTKEIEDFEEARMLVEDLKIMFAFSQTKAELKKNRKRDQDDSIGEGKAISWNTYENRVFSVTFEKGRMSFFLMDKRYDFEPIMMGSMLEVKKKSENLSELDKELIGRLREQLLELNAHYFDEEVIELKQKKVVGWGVDQDLRYVVQFDDGSDLYDAEWGSILDECTRENLKEMYEQRCTVIKVAVNDRDNPDQAKKRKFALECLFWLFEPFRLLGVKNSNCEEIKEWRWFEKCRVYSLNVNGKEMEYYFEECETDALDIQRLQCMMNVSLSTKGEPTRAARLLVKKIETYLKRRLRNLAPHAEKSCQVYVEQPEGFVDPKYPEHVYVLDKALYGLKQAPRAWYETLSIYLLGFGYKKGTVDPTLFLRRSGNHLTVVQIYVDDIIFASTNPESCTEFEQIMKSRFQMSMMGELTFFLGLQVRQTPQGIFINQSKYTLDILKRFDFTGPKSASTPMSTSFQLDADTSGNPVDQKVYRAIIGSLLYLTASRPDIMFATCVCARFQCDPRESHLGAVKRILKYLKGTPNFGLWYPKDSGFELTAFTDSDHAGCKLNRKSTSGACQFLGDKLVSWSSRKQNCVSLSTAEAEYVAAACCCSQVLWMKIQLADYGYTMHRIPIYCDSSSAIQIAANPVQHSRTKHIDIRYHFIKDHVEKGNVELFFVESERQIADLFTKAFNEKRHYYLLSKLGMLDPPADF
ncbi:hypothetical protein OSB04_021110 [Centaurea solstitialis]|uniref:Reverse transcriptase Ty1/copia-type domain-containing protein n=1 Tax=Centaurea solstitialis TaxID=347529 RepID=A0AA38W6H9_9ASTR|nr:hypothetical protein OSB04_021110 [Centaurea solstitialis]